LRAGPAMPRRRGWGWGLRRGWHSGWRRTPAYLGAQAAGHTEGGGGEAGGGPGEAARPKQQGSALCRASALSQARRAGGGLGAWPGRGVGGVITALGPPQREPPLPGPPPHARWPRPQPRPAARLAGVQQYVSGLRFLSHLLTPAAIAAHSIPPLLHLVRFRSPRHPPRFPFVTRMHWLAYPLCCVLQRRPEPSSTWGVLSLGTCLRVRLAQDLAGCNLEPSARLGGGRESGKCCGLGCRGQAAELGR
jgi:hypothetical protein